MEPLVTTHVVLPLTDVGEMLAAVVFDDDFELAVDQVASAEEAFAIVDVDVALRFGQSRADDIEPHDRFPWRLDTLSYEGQGMPGQSDSVHPVGGVDICMEALQSRVTIGQEPIPGSDEIPELSLITHLTLPTNREV